MTCRWLALLVLLGCLAPGVRADKTPPVKDGPTYQVPYRLTNVLHVMVRTKINGKGPYNFIIDTGAPIVILTKEAGKKLGLKGDKKGWTTVERLDVEGGITRPKVKILLETPFQLEGMNAMGLAGAEIHGILGYTFLAQYRLGFDFTRDRMTWTELPFKPPPPQPLGKKEAAPPDLGFVATLMKVMSLLVGRPPPPEIAPRGYLGMELAEADDGGVMVKAVLAGSPAAKARLLAGDRIEQVQGKAVKNAAEVHRRAAKVTAGQEVRLTIRRSDEILQISVTAGEGL
jgi:membrane-associated protease RseP (regulator of RpoE activity)